LEDSEELLDHLRMIHPGVDQGVRRHEPGKIPCSLVWLLSVAWPGGSQQKGQGDDWDSDTGVYAHCSHLCGRPDRLSLSVQAGVPARFCAPIDLFLEMSGSGLDRRVWRREKLTQPFQPTGVQTRHRAGRTAQVLGDLHQAKTVVHLQ